MFARKAAPRGRADLFERVGAFLRAQGLGPEPANYAFAHDLLLRDDPAARALVARLEDEGVRLSGAEVAALGGGVVAGPALAPDPDPGPDPGPSPADTGAQVEAAERVVAQTRAQVEAAAQVMRAMHQETRGFGRDLAARAALLAGPGTGAAGIDAVARLTHAMIARAADTEARLAAAAAEADALRAELARAQEAARRDPLTGLPNRRALGEAFAAPAPAGRCLAVCDIDRFKRINDAFGHPVGDRVLSAAARVLADACPDAFVARQGGEEFAVLVPDGDLAAAAALLDEARRRMGERRFRTRATDQAIGRVTFSAGVVRVGPGEAVAAALARADALLYRAKAAGRDRVVAG